MSAAAVVSEAAASTCGLVKIGDGGNNVSIYDVEAASSTVPSRSSRMYLGGDARRGSLGGVQAERADRWVQLENHRGTSFQNGVRTHQTPSSSTKPTIEINSLSDVTKSGRVNMRRVFGENILAGHLTKEKSWRELDDLSEESAGACKRGWKKWQGCQGPHDTNLARSGTCEGIDEGADGWNMTSSDCTLREGSGTRGSPGEIG